MELRFLDFDFSGDAEGHGSFDAMAAAVPAQRSALEAEIVQVLDWATRRFGAAAPLEEGGEWDYDLQAVEEMVTPLAARFDAAQGKLAVQALGNGTPRVTWTLTVSGTEAFCDAFRAACGLD